MMASFALNIADREGQWIFQFQMISGARSIIIVVTLITGVLFKQFSICTAVYQGKYSRQRTVMDTSLSDIIEARGTITTL